METAAEAEAGRCSVDAYASPSLSFAANKAENRDNIEIISAGAALEFVA